jgi:hypothetical protein
MSRRRPGQVGAGYPDAHSSTSRSPLRRGGRWMTPCWLAGCTRFGACSQQCSGDRHPCLLQPFVLDVTRVDRERQGSLDVSRPTKVNDAAEYPVVIFVHGGPVPADLRPTPRDWPGFIGYACAVVHHGLIAVTVDHRLYDTAACPTAAADVRAAVERARTLEGVDARRVALWFFWRWAAGHPVAGAPPSWLGCVALTYPVLAPPPGWGCLVVSSRSRR